MSGLLDGLRPKT